MYEQATYFDPKIQIKLASQQNKGEMILRRNYEIKVRFNEDEFVDLMKKVSLSKLSRENFLRQCVKKSVFKEPPQLDYYQLKNEFNHIGNNLNQIAKSLNSCEGVSPKMIEITLEELRQMIQNLDEKVR